MFKLRILEIGKYFTLHELDMNVEGIQSCFGIWYNKEHKYAGEPIYDKRLALEIMKWLDLTVDRFQE